MNGLFPVQKKRRKKKSLKVLLIVSKICEKGKFRFDCCGSGSIFPHFAICLSTEDGVDVLVVQRRGVVRERES